MTTSDPILYGHPFSSYCQKVLTAFYEKGAPFDWRLLSPETPENGAEFGALWPVGKFPVLRQGDLTLVESSIIIEWLDQQTPAAPRLVPADPQVALQVRMFDRIFDNYVMSPMQAIVADRLRPDGSQDPFGVAQAKGMLDRSYAWLDGQLAGRQWAAGDFSLADCAAGPALFYAAWVHPFDDHQNLAAYYRRVRARSAFSRAVDEARPFRSFFPGGAPMDRD